MMRDMVSHGKWQRSWATLSCLLVQKEASTTYLNTQNMQPSHTLRKMSVPDLDTICYSLNFVHPPPKFKG